MIENCLADYILGIPQQPKPKNEELQKKIVNWSGLKKFLEKILQVLLEFLSKDKGEIIKNLQVILELDLELIDLMNSDKQIEDYFKDWLRVLSRECAVGFLDQLKIVSGQIKELENLDQIKCVESCV